MQTANTDTPQTFPRLATYLEYDAPAPFPITVPDAPIIQCASPAGPAESDATGPSSFEAILDAYDKNPDRWDSLE